jgi:hypothetical protein
MNEKILLLKFLSNKKSYQGTRVEKNESKIGIIWGIIIKIFRMRSFRCEVFCITQSFGLRKEQAFLFILK